MADKRFSGLETVQKTKGGSKPVNARGLAQKNSYHNLLLLHGWDLEKIKHGIYAVNG